MNSKSVGETTEAIILAHLLKSGHSVSIPFGNNQRYDMILDDGSTLTRVQCKTGRYRDGCVVFQTSSTNGFTGKKTGYTGHADLFMVYCPELNSIYKVDVSEAPPKSNMTLRVEQPDVSYKMSSINWAKDYKVD